MSFDFGEFVDRAFTAPGTGGQSIFHNPAAVIDTIGGANTLKDVEIGGAAALAAFGLPEIGAGLDALGTGLGAIGGDLGLSGLGSVASSAAPLSLADADAAGVGGALGDVGTAGAAGATPSLGGFDLSTIGAGAGAAPSTATGALPDWLNGATIGTGVNPSDATSAFGANPFATATSPVAAGTASPAASSPGFLSSFTSNFNPTSIGAAAGKALANPLTDLGIVGLGANLYSGYQQNQQIKALNSAEQANAQQAASISAADTAAAQPLLTSGESLTQYLATGTLPPAFQAQLQQQIAAARASIIQGYASRGMSTNPQQNSQLNQDLNNVNLQSEALQANLESTLNTAGTQLVSTANNLISSGLSALQISAQLPLQVSQLNSQLNAQMAQSISSFAAALNGSGTKSGVTLTLPNNVVTPSGGLNLG